MVNQISSLLWKASLLAGESQHFPRLVGTAASHLGKDYTDRMLRTVAADTDVLAALDLPADEGVDAVLTAIASDPVKSADMDARIVAAVTAYTPPTEGA